MLNRCSTNSHTQYAEPLLHQLTKTICWTVAPPTHKNNLLNRCSTNSQKQYAEPLLHQLTKTICWTTAPPTHENNMLNHCSTNSRKQYAEPLLHQLTKTICWTTAPPTLKQARWLPRQRLPLWETTSYSAFFPILLVQGSTIQLTTHAIGKEATTHTKM